MTRLAATFCACVLFIATWGAGTARGQGAEDYPTKPVKLMVPFPAGGANDILARIVAEKLKVKWGQPVIVENRPGAGGNIGADLAAQSEPDGYTLLVCPPGPLTINQSLYKRLSYNSEEFVPITVLASVPNLVLVRHELNVNSLKELIELAKKNPGKLTFASQGNGSTAHLNGNMFMLLTGTRLTHVPYRGESLALTDMLGGHVDIMFGNLSATLPYHRDGKLKIIAVAEERRASAIPDVPTTTEAGLPAFRSTAWFAMAAPPKTKPAVVARISQAMMQVLADPDTQAQFRAQGVEPVGDNPAKTAAFLRDERERWREVIQKTGVTVE